MKGIVFGLALIVSASALAGPSPEDELAARSGLPASRIQALLQDCDANQTSMNFCAWRTQLVAERDLQQAVDRHIAAHPDRKRAFESKIARWKQARDASCDKSARQAWGDGSMLPMARATCAAAATTAMIGTLTSQGTRTP
ncbi:MAG: lysozyme inhibitor LprI family protein [Burkholderia gladioli]